MGLTGVTGNFICEARTGRNVQHELAVLRTQRELATSRLRQSVLEA